ncbi:MAG: N-acetylmuramic acid 6-phosphate etherase [Phycisphaerales bacterium]|nr:N-acetylmuramic acid 6-phosphate etherase [Phycisphaerales bacterium]
MTEPCPPLPPDRSHISTEQTAGDPPLDLCQSSAIVARIAQAQQQAIGQVAAAAGAIGAFIDELIERGGRLIYLGAGTSGRLGVLDASECPPTFGSERDAVVGLIAGGDRALRVSSEATEDDAKGAMAELERLEVNSIDAVLGIAAGGTTPWVLGGIKAAHARGACTGLLTCARRDPPPGCDHLIELDTGAEVVRGSTRLAAAAATKAALNAISTALFVHRGAVHGDLMVNLRATNDKLLDRAIRMLQIFAPDLDRAAAARAILEADGELKTAIACTHTGLSPADARTRLGEVGGRLRALIS